MISVNFLTCAQYSKVTSSSVYYAEITAPKIILISVKICVIWLSLQNYDISAYTIGHHQATQRKIYIKSILSN